MLWMWMMSFALASDCPWSYAPTTVEASGKMVTVDGETFYTAGFAAVLTACGEEDAVDSLMRWQTMRVATWGLAGAGSLLVFPLLITPVTGTMSVLARSKMKRQLLDGEPTSP